MKIGKMILSIIFSLLALVVSQTLSQVITSIFYLIKVPVFICNMAAGILYVVIAYLFIKLICEKYIKDDLGNYGIPKFKLKIQWILVAIVLPVFVLGCYMLLDGSWIENPVDLKEKLNIASSAIFFYALGAGVVEEMVFRGIILNVIEKKFNKIVAILVPSVLFGIVHILGQKFEILSCALVIVAGTMVGIMFSLIATRGKSVWNSAIVHVFWNLLMCSGIVHIGNAVDEYSLYSYILENDSFILTGGEFGVESSAIAVAGYCIVIVVILFFKRKKVTEK